MCKDRKYSIKYPCEQKKELFKTLLLAWGKNNFRPYPWRNSRNPYHILIAEFMLQRTRADQAAKVYKKFILLFPSLESLVKAPVDSVATALLPLGLPYRATRIKTAVESMQQRHGGRIPASPEKLMEFPGIGRYIANAVSCFAFRKNVPIVDANILRILNRVFSFNFNSNSHKNGEPWNFLGQIISGGKAKDFNYALIDHGDAICTARNPKCSICPLNKICDYYKELEFQRSVKV